MIDVWIRVVDVRWWLLTNVLLLLITLTTKDIISTGGALSLRQTLPILLWFRWWRLTWTATLSLNEYGSTWICMIALSLWSIAPTRCGDSRWREFWLRRRHDVVILVSRRELWCSWCRLLTKKEGIPLCLAPLLQREQIVGTFLLSFRSGWGTGTTEIVTVSRWCRWCCDYVIIVDLSLTCC